MQKKTQKVLKHKSQNSSLKILRQRYRFRCSDKLYTLCCCTIPLYDLFYSSTEISSRQPRKPAVALNVRHPVQTHKSHFLIQPSSLLTPSSCAAATFPDNSGLADSRQCLKDSTPGSVCLDITVTGNHLDIPRTGDNPNLLSPEVSRSLQIDL